MRVLITGGCGFIGSNVAVHCARRGHEITVIDNFFRLGSEQNLKWMQSESKINFTKVDVRHGEVVSEVIKGCRPDVVFHLAGQVAMTTSLKDPMMDFQINALGSLNILESVRNFCPEALVLYSSTNKVYGDLDHLSIIEKETRYELKDLPHGVSENEPLSFQSPYGCSKGAADQYMLDYARLYGVNTIVFRHSSVFGARQFSNYDQGWVGWFVQKAIEQKGNRDSSPFTVSGNGKQVRDLLHIDDLVDCYFSIIEKGTLLKGSVFNIGGGMSNSMSLIELLHFLENQMKVKLNYKHIEWRASDQKVFVSNNEKLSRVVGWAPKISKTDGLNRMIDWVAGL